MWTYNKTLQYPINIKCPDPRLAKVIISQYGGPDGELAASLRYLSQRFGMPDQNAKAILNDIGTEELAHLEMVGTIVHQLTRGASIEEIEFRSISITMPSAISIKILSSVSCRITPQIPPMVTILSPTFNEVSISARFFACFC